MSVFVMEVTALPRSTILVACLAAASSLSCSSACEAYGTSGLECINGIDSKEGDLAEASDETMLMQVSLFQTEVTNAPSSEDAKSLRQSSWQRSVSNITGAEVEEAAKPGHAALEAEKPFHVRKQKTVTKVRASAHSFEDSRSFPNILSKKRHGDGDDDDDDSSRPFSVNDLIPGSIMSGLSNATFRKLAIAINMSIQAIDTKATDLLAACLSFEESIVVAVKRAGDKAFEEVSTRLLAFSDPFMSRWLHVTDAVAQAVPLLTKALTAVGKGGLARPLNQTMTRVLHDASLITKELRNTTNLVHQLADLHNATNEEIDDIMALVDNYTSDGLAKVRDLGETLQWGLLKFISDLAKKLTGVSLPAVENLQMEKAKVRAPEEGSIEELLDKLSGEVAGMVESLKTGLDTTFQGVERAMQQAANQEKSGALRSAWRPSLYLCIVAGGMMQLL